MVTRRTLFAKPFLYAIIDAPFVGSRPLGEWAALVAGPDRAASVQWRFKGLPDDEALRGAIALRAATSAVGASFFVNDRPDIAKIAGADGVHVGQDDMDVEDVRSRLPDALIGVSTHNETQFEAALDTSADYIAVGPVFGTSSKAKPDPVVGLDFVRWAASLTDRPLVAIGGIDLENAASIMAAGAHGICVISRIMNVERPDEAARAFRRAMA